MPLYVYAFVLSHLTHDQATNLDFANRVGQSFPIGRRDTARSRRDHHRQDEHPADPARL